MAHFGFPVYAAGLCASFRGEWFYGIPLDDTRYETVADILLQTRGEAINRCRPGPAKAPPSGFGSWRM